jgi:hypothetical protein
MDAAIIPCLRVMFKPTGVGASQALPAARNITGLSEPLHLFNSDFTQSDDMYAQDILVK